MHALFLEQHNACIDEVTSCYVVDSSSTLPCIRFCRDCFWCNKRHWMRTNDVCCITTTKNLRAKHHPRQHNKRTVSSSVKNSHSRQNVLKRPTRSWRRWEKLSSQFLVSVIIVEIVRRRWCIAWFERKKLNACLKLQRRQENVPLFSRHHHHLWFLSLRPPYSSTTNNSILQVTLLLLRKIRKSTTCCHFHMTCDWLVAFSLPDIILEGEENIYMVMN